MTVNEELTEIDEAADPFALFGAWMGEAEISEPNDANAMAVATAGRDGMPSVRMILLKGLDDRGFVFYTNTESPKGQQLAENPKAGICFHWKSLRRQVRARGAVERVSEAEAGRIFRHSAAGLPDRCLGLRPIDRPAFTHRPGRADRVLRPEICRRGRAAATSLVRLPRGSRGHRILA